jgi:hypothetical protein
MNSLEAATSRLEDLAVANTNDFREAHAQRSSTTPSLSKEATPQFNTGVFTPEARSSVAEEPIAPEEKPPVVLDYEKIISDNVDPWVVKSEKVGEVVGEQVFRLWGFDIRHNLFCIYFKFNLSFCRFYSRRRNLLLR